MRHTRGVEIRELQPHEADRAVELWAECGLTRPWNDPHADLARALGGANSTVLAAVRGEELVGTAMVGHDGHRGWVYYLAVAPGRRRDGVGRCLMEACEQWLRDRGAPKVQLMVRQGNAAVVEFYAALGYTDQGTITLGRFLDPELEARRRMGSER
nr:GNAT family acetyltransferase [Ornithinimicrobium sp. F0845]